MRAILFVACLSLGLLSFAPEGHPLKGSWAGDWGSTAGQRSPFLIVMDWDGHITGTINPGDNAITIGSVFLDVTNWTVRIEADGKDQAGRAVHIAAEGKLDDIASAHRKLTGSWVQGTAKGDFRLTRD